MHLRSIALLATLTLCACENDKTIGFESVGSPEGGSVFALTNVQVGEKSMMVAAGEFGLYQNDGSGFQHIESQLLPTFRLISLDHIRDSPGTLPFPRSSLFTSFGPQLWTIDADSRPWMSLDGGRTFNFIEIPSVSPQPSTIRPTDPLRLVVADKLYLTHPRHIWVLENIDNLDSWSALDLSSVILDESELEMPPAIRNLLPANAIRKFDVLTVLSEQLMIYRRDHVDSVQHPWILTSTFPVAERQLAGFDGNSGAESASALFLATHDALYRSDDHGEQWVRFWPRITSNIEVVLPLLTPDGQIVVVGTSDGSIWRHDGHKWELTRSGPSSTSAITSLTENDGTLWAATLGSGILTSADFGVSWHETNHGLKAVRTRAFLALDDEVIVATNAGVFRKKQDSWTELYSSSATSLLKISAQDVLAGTSDGRIVQLSGETLHTREATRAPEFLPDSLARHSPAPEAIVGFQADGERVMAWSRSKGSSLSKDGGETWEDFSVPEALTNTLKGSTISHIFQLGEEIVLAEKSQRRGTPAQLWISRDGGSVWSALRSFQDGPGPVILKMGRAGVLYAAHQDRIEYSQDRVRWSRIAGPWSASQIIGFHLNGERAGVLVDNHGTVELYIKESIREDGIQRFALSPVGLNISSVLDFQVVGSQVYILTPRGLIVGTLPYGDQAYQQSYPALVALVGLFTAMWLSFSMLRRFG